MMLSEIRKISWISHPMTIMTRQPESESLRFSIIIPVYNRASDLSACLESIQNLNYPRGLFEVLVTDDGSNARLDPACFIVPGDLKFRILRQDHAGPAAARNHAARHARGRYLAFLDVDCRPEPGWLSQMEYEFDKHPGAALAGKILNGSPQSLLATASHLVLDYSFRFYNRASLDASFLASGNLAVNAKLFYAIGGFNRNFLAAEDREFSDSWRMKGFPLFFAQNARVSHAHSVSIKAFLNRHFRYGRGAFLYHRLRARRRGHFMRLAPADFYLQLFYRPMSSMRFPKFMLLAFLILLSQISSLAGFLFEGACPRQLELIARPGEDAA